MRARGGEGRPGPALTTSRWAFLRAAWRRLVLVTYAVEPARLEPWLPPGLTFDLRDGQAFVSLVAFDFLETKVLGMGWPGLRDFPEINLRFYVREGERRGVAFVREWVPSHLVAGVARWLYNEPYQAAPMTSSHRVDGDRLIVEHRLSVGGDQTLRVEADAAPTLPAEDSLEHFFKEHSWGYGTSRRGRLVRYEVQHPRWRTHRVRSLDLAWDWGAVYGAAWADLAGAEPASVVLAEGSPVAVSPR